ncbi:hypothetical protein IWQ56_000006 [Coemansia nantahalensis]|nr:hypothetical protein IWQ56_000006 [Coemansia nantahalensis]
MYHSDEVPLEALPLDARDWRYSCEGNLKMAFAYCGVDARLRGWLLLLDKCSADAGSLPAAAAAHDAELQQKLDAAQFAARVVGPLIGSRYVLPRRLVRAPARFLEQLSGAAAAAHRPAHRASKQIDVGRQCLVLVPSMLARAGPAHGPGVHSVTVELKTKWGFLPRSALIAPENRVRRQTCRYCMHQSLKHGPRGGSAFCPLDLFSGSPERVAHALDCLERSPQNNLRVFVDGVAVDDFGARVPRWCDFRRALRDILLADGLLPRLARVQQRLDALDIEGVYPAYRRALASGALAAEEPAIADWLQAVEQFQRRDGSDGGSSDKQAVLEFLLSTVLKDISVMIAVGHWPSEASAPGALPEYRIAVVDTEPKKLVKMPAYHKLNQDIVAKYLEYHPDPAQWKVCHE